ncbi:MAG: single-stranded DNA-binding protein [Ruminococcus sp.]|nr:single-stranded DNA-binding protein [Ruminococcus sp.]
MFNKVILMGRLVADPELRQTPNNISVCRFTIAVNRGFSSANAERQADFFNVTAWRQNAEFASKYFTKGRLVIVDGSIQNNNYTDANGVKHYSVEIVADRVAFGESKSASASNGGGSYQPSGNFQQPSYQNDPQPAKASNESVQIGDLGDFEEILSDGDVPF